MSELPEARSREFTTPLPIEEVAALRASQRRLKAVLETMDEGIVVQSRDGAIIECNAAAERILGLTRDQLMGRTSVDPRWRSIHGDGSPFPGETHPASVTLRTGQPSTGTLMGVHKPSGELTWIRINARVVEYERDGSPASVLTTFHDVTEQHEANTALAGERAFLAALLEHLPGSFLAVVDDAQRITRIFGHEKLRPTAGRVLVGEAITVLGRGHERRALLEAAAEALAGHPMPIHTRLDDADLELVFVPLPGESGQSPRALVIGRDVTERNRLRESLERHERLVTTGTLAAGVAHEINNPLSYVVVNLALAIEDLQGLGAGVPAETLREVIAALTEASEGAERIRKIVRGMRTFAREQSVPVATDLADTAELSVHMAMHELRPRATVLQEHAPAPAALADKSRLSQAIVQLLMNAGQAFATADTGRNQVLVRTGSAPDGRVFLDVTDNGPGIAPEVLPRIFDPFFTTRPVGQGSGLGLSIAHNLVSDLGGELRVRTRVGEGTTFEILLPATPASPVVTERPTVRGRSTTRGRVLLIDDEPHVLAMLERLLRAEHDCVATTDPREAMRELDGDPRFDAIFCDLMMPHIDGMQVYERIRARHPTLLNRVVFVTGGALQGRPHAAFLESVPNPCIDKPFDPEHLRAVARRLVRARS
jgi:PAS domain S-box-containing protein